MGAVSFPDFGSEFHLSDFGLGSRGVNNLGAWVDRERNCDVGGGWGAKRDQ